MAEINQAISSSIMTEHEVDPSHFMPITLEDLDEGQRQDMEQHMKTIREEA